MKYFVLRDRDGQLVPTSAFYSVDSPGSGGDIREVLLSVGGPIIGSKEKLKAFLESLTQDYDKSKYKIVPIKILTKSQYLLPE